MQIFDKATKARFRSCIFQYQKNKRLYSMRKYHFNGTNTFLMIDFFVFDLYDIKYIFLKFIHLFFTIELYYFILNNWNGVIKRHEQLS